MKENKIVVLFPGVNYGVDCPLLYFAGVKFTSRGYTRVDINYADYAKSADSLEECIEDVEEYALTQLKGYDFNKYDDIVFVSKSIGTIVAGWAEEKLDIKVRHIVLTPIKETLPYINEEKNIITVISGTKDNHIDSLIIKEHCERYNINYHEIVGVGHRLEFKDDVDKSIAVLREIVGLY